MSKKKTKLILKKKSTTAKAVDSSSDETTPKTKTEKLRFKLKKSMAYEVEGAVGGVHAHSLPASNPSMTAHDGAHSHIFMINGRPFISDYDGEHEHSIEAEDNITGPSQPHNHRVLVDNDMFMTEEGGEHEHELQLSSTTMDGLHRHSLTLLDNTVIESLLPSDILTAAVAKAKYNLAIHTLKFDVSRFPNPEDAQKWAVENGYSVATVVPDGTMKSHVFQQLNREQFVETSLLEMKLVDGVSAVFGVLQPKEESQHPAQDAEFMSYNMMQDRITRGEEILNVEDRVRLLNLKDNLKASLTDLKHNLNSHLEAIGQLVATIEDESQRKVFDRYKSTYEMVMQELNEVEVEREPTADEKQTQALDPLDAILAIEKDAVELQEALDESSLQNFADLLGSFVLTTEKVLQMKGKKEEKKPGKDKDDKKTQKNSVKAPVSFHIPIHIKKAENSEEERMVFGIVLEPNDGGDKGVPLDPDEHGDIYSQDDVKKAAYSFMEDEDGGNHGFMHRFFMNEDFTLLENFVTKGKTFIETEKSIVELRKGTWVMGIRVNSDSIWNMIKNGEITGFSIGGVAEVEEL